MMRVRRYFWAAVLFIGLSDSGNVAIAMKPSDEVVQPPTLRTQFLGHFPRGEDKVEWIDSLHERAFGENNPQSFYNLGIMYFLGEDVEHSYEFAANCFYLAAHWGYVTSWEYLPDAYHNLGVLCHYGWGVAKNAQHATRFFDLARGVAAEPSLPCKPPGVLGKCHGK